MSLLVSFPLVSWLSADVQCSYYKCMYATRPINCQVLAWLYLSVQANKRALRFCLKLFFLSSAWLILHFCFACFSAANESLWYFELVTYPRQHFCANDVYLVVGCIRMQLTCLLSVFSPYWQPSYPFGSKKLEGIESRLMICVHHSHDWGQ
jgi:hypothetical protein